MARLATSATEKKISHGHGERNWDCDGGSIERILILVTQIMRLRLNSIVPRIFAVTTGLCHPLKGRKFSCLLFYQIPRTDTVRRWGISPL